jgi:endo-1,4-beta-D-glucanase Y
MISDFEDTPGKGTIVKPPPVSTMDGYWYSFMESTCTNQKPTSVDGGAVATEKDGSNNAMHATIASCGSTSSTGKYSGVGVALHPTSSDGKKKGPVDLSAYDGISFKIKGTSTTQIYVEFQTTDCTTSDGGGTATSSNSDAYNCPGYLIKTVPTSWTTMYVPFGLVGVRWFPTSAAGGTSKCTTSEFCEAPALDLTKVQDIQFALEGPFNEKPQSIASFDFWVDDLALYKFSDTPKDSGIATIEGATAGNHPFPANKTFTGCTMPKGADGKLLKDAYVLWKSKFVSGGKVISPEIDNGATVSEGIGYGMLLAVYFGDKPLFDQLLSYLKSNAISGASLLMNWKQPGGNGSASDADEDAAFALQMAVKQWGSSYASDASAVLQQFLAKDVDSSGNLTPGSDFTNNGASALWNPSYFAPAYYKYFATVDTANASKWNGLVTKGYAYLSSISASNGLVPAWCTSNCTARGGGGYTDADKYQYDSHRMPFRTGLDACWNNSSDAKSYISKVVGFFAGKAGAAKAAGGGLGTIADIYDSSGAPTSNSANNSMSLLGCAGVGSLSYTGTNADTFRDRVWKFLLEGAYTKNYMYTNGDSASKPGYTYYNATVGLMTALAMSGNFYVME